MCLMTLRGPQSRNSPSYIEAKNPLPFTQVTATDSNPETQEPSRQLLHFLRSSSSIPRLFKLSLSFRFPIQNAICLPLTPTSVT